jgi:hypothetical protein
VPPPDAREAADPSPTNPSQIMNDLNECEECGTCFKPSYDEQCVCPDCEMEHTLRVVAEQKERLMDAALDCRCGAYGISKSTGQPYHCADCVCGRT